VERGLNPNATATATFSYSCGGGTVQRCQSGKVGGWLDR
jgi:hypothetical protein